MEITILDYILVYLTSMLIGIVLSYIIFNVLEKRARKKRTLKDTIREMAISSSLVEAKERKEIVSNIILFEPKLIKTALDLVTFSENELARNADIDQKVVSAWLNAAKSAGIVSTISERNRNVYKINLNAEFLNQLVSIKDIFEHNFRLSTQLNEKILNMEYNTLKRLITIGVKNIIFIRFDNVTGPELSYFIQLTRFVKKSVGMPQILARITISSEISYFTEIEGGDKIVITKYEFSEEERTLHNFIIGEIMESDDVERVKRFLNNLARALRGQREFNREHLQEILEVESRRFIKEIF